MLVQAVLAEPRRQREVAADPVRVEHREHVRVTQVRGDARLAHHAVRAHVLDPFGQDELQGDHVPFDGVPGTPHLRVRPLSETLVEQVFAQSGTAPKGLGHPAVSGAPHLPSRHPAVGQDSRWGNAPRSASHRLDRTRVA